MGNDRKIRVDDLRAGDTINYKGWYHQVQDVKYYETVTYYKILTDGNPIIVGGNDEIWKIEV